MYYLTKQSAIGRTDCRVLWWQPAFLWWHPALTRGGVFRGQVGLFYLRLGLFSLQLAFDACWKLAWSFLLMLEVRSGLFCSRWKIGLVFFTCGFPRPEIDFWSFLLTVPTLQVKWRTVSKQTSIVSKKDTSLVGQCRPAVPSFSGVLCGSVAVSDTEQVTPWMQLLYDFHLKASSARKGLERTTSIMWKNDS